MNFYLQICAVARENGGTLHYVEICSYVTPLQPLIRVVAPRVTLLHNAAAVTYSHRKGVLNLAL